MDTNWVWIRGLVLGLLCATLVAGGLQTAMATEDGAPGEETMESSGMPQLQPGSGEHPLCWLDIQAKDMAASQEFYGKLFGWTFQDYGMPDYIMFSPPAGLMGALTAKPDDLEQAQGSMAHIYTGDIDSDIAALEAMGLRFIQPKTTVAEGCHTAVFSDTAGTLYGLVDMAPQLPVPKIPSPLGPGPKPPAGALCSIELYGGDFAKAKEFFGGHFGWSLVDTMPQYMMFDPGAGICGVFQGHTPAGKSMPYIYVEDVAAKLAEIVAAGGKSMGEPGAVPGLGTFGYFSDPSGTPMGLIGP